MNEKSLRCVSVKTSLEAEDAIGEILFHIFDPYMFIQRFNLLSVILKIITMVYERDHIKAQAAEIKR